METWTITWTNTWTNTFTDTFTDTWTVICKSLGKSEKTPDKSLLCQYTIEAMAELFQRNKSTISRHIRNVRENGELQRNSVVAENATTTSDGRHGTERQKLSFWPALNLQINTELTMCL